MAHVIILWIGTCNTTKGKTLESFSFMNERVTITKTTII